MKMICLDQRVQEFKWERILLFIEASYVSNLFVLLLSTNYACLPFFQEEHIKVFYW